MHPTKLSIFAPMPTFLKQIHDPLPLIITVVEIVVVLLAPSLVLSLLFTIILALTGLMLIALEARWGEVCKERYSVTAFGLVLLLCGAVSGLVMYGISSTGQEYINLAKIFDSQLTLLSVAIALGAYVSALLTKLRETLTRAKAEVSDIDGGGFTADRLRIHEGDYFWLKWTDLILIVLGVLLIVRVALFARGYSNSIFDKALLGGLVFVILYFACLHIRRWYLYWVRSLTARPAPVPPEEERTGKILEAINEVKESVAKLSSGPFTSPKLDQAQVEGLTSFHGTMAEQLDARLSESHKFLGVLVLAITAYAYVIWYWELSRGRFVLLLVSAISYLVTIWAIWYLAALGYAFRFLQYSMHQAEKTLGWEKLGLPSGTVGQGLPRVIWLHPGIYQAHLFGVVSLMLLVCVTLAFKWWHIPEFVPDVLLNKHTESIILGVVGLVGGLSFTVGINLFYVSKYEKKTKQRGKSS